MPTLAALRHIIKRRLIVHALLVCGHQVLDELTRKT